MLKRTMLTTGYSPLMVNQNLKSRCSFTYFSNHFHLTPPNGKQIAMNSVVRVHIVAI